MSGHFGALGESANYPNERFVSTAPVFFQLLAALLIRLSSSSVVAFHR